MSRTTQFIATLRPYVEKAAAGKFPAAPILAQAVIEADHGDEPAYRFGNNPFGVKANAGWRGDTITLAADGQAAVRFRKYATLEEACRVQVDLLTSDYYAYAARWAATDPWRWAYELQRGEPDKHKAGYCTNSKYADLIVEILEDFQLMTPYEIEAMKAKARTTKAGIVRPDSPDAWKRPATKEEIAVLLCRVADLNAKGGKL